MEYRPIARSSDLVVQEVGEETLVYDLKTNKAKCLNETSAMIWKLCDGTRSAVEITMALSAELKTKVEQDLVLLAFDQLQKEELLTSKSDGVFALEGTSRRELIKKVGFAAVVALPVIGTVTAPTAAQTGSVNECDASSGLNCDCGVNGPSTPDCIAAATGQGFVSANRTRWNGTCEEDDISCVASNCPPNVNKCCKVLEKKACGVDPNSFDPCCVPGPLPPLP